MTPQELAQFARRQQKYPDRMNQIPGSLGNDAQVDAAYRKLMSFQASADANKGSLTRNLSTNIDMSHQNRGKSLQNAHQGFSDRGILNSGIALQKDVGLNTQYDTTDQQMQNNYTDALRGMDRTGNDYLQQFQDAQIQASQRAIQAKADADAQALQAQRDAELQAQQQADLLTALQQSAYQPPTPAVAVPSVIPAVAGVALKKKVTPVIKSPIPKLKLKGYS